MRPMVQASGPIHLLEKTHVGETTQHSSNGTGHGFDFGIVRLQRRTNRRSLLMAAATTLNSIFRSIDEKGTGKVSRAAINFYESLGFLREGKLAGRILNVDGSVECDIPMARAVNSRLDWAYSRAGTTSAARSTGFIKPGSLTRKTGVIASHVAAVLVMFAVLDDTPPDTHATDFQVDTPTILQLPMVDGGSPNPPSLALTIA